MSAKTLDLRGLTPDDAAHRINEAIAIEVLGWTKYAIPGHGNYFRDEKSLLRSTNFSTSADAVLPLLEKSGKDIVIVWSGGSWSVDINEDRDVGTENYNVATIGSYDCESLAEAACIALLMANGIEVLT